jgi:hypothetical protein
VFWETFVIFLQAPNIFNKYIHYITRKVFGGDVLTNERAYSTQLAMLNHATDYDKLTGVIHRPEGLHTCILIFKHLNHKDSAKMNLFLPSC